MFQLFGFSIQEFFICYFYCQKTAFVCEFQHTPLRKMIFSQCSTTLVGVRFCTHEEEEFQALCGSGVNEVSFRARPHCSVHNTLGIDT
jgi:hypothetical protein